jgi:hypothetical protein
MGWTLSVRAQLTSDLVPRQRLVPRREQVEGEVNNSRYHLGPIRVQPRLMIRDFGYNDNVLGSATNPVSDWTATAAGGIHWIVPMGGKVYLRGDALPEYTWYKELTDRRYFGGTYNASLLMLFNRMSVEATGSTQKSIATVSSELEAPAQRKVDGGLGEIEVEVLPKFSLYASGQTERHRYTAVRGTDLARVNQLDRDDVAARGGIRYAPADFFDIRLGAESTQSEFDRNPELRDNKSTAILLGMHYDRPKSYVNLSVGRRKGEQRNGSIFPAYETTTGSYFLSRSLTAPLEFQLYGHRRVSYAVTSTVPYFLETRNGAAAIIRIGNRASLRGFGELGKNDYSLAVLGTSAAGAARNDDVVTYGGGVAVRLYRNIALSIAVSQSDYDSTINDFDRSIVRVYTGLTFSGEFSR